MEKTYIDSNIIIRLIVKDSAVLLLEAQKIVHDIEKGKFTGLISVLVINEIIWILESYYDIKRDVFIPWLLKLLALKNIKIVEIKKDTLINILIKMEKKKIDFTDLYLAETRGKAKIVSFDRDFEKLQN